MTSSPDIIASREYTFVNQPARLIRVDLHRPQQEGRDWFTLLSFTGIESQPFDQRVWGAYPLQPIEISIGAMEHRLRPLSKQIACRGCAGDLGLSLRPFPVTLEAARQEEFEAVVLQMRRDYAAAVERVGGIGHGPYAPAVRANDTHVTSGDVVATDDRRSSSSGDRDTLIELERPVVQPGGHWLCAWRYLGVGDDATHVSLGFDSFMAILNAILSITEVTRNYALNGSYVMPRQENYLAIYYCIPDLLGPNYAQRLDDACEKLMAASNEENRQRMAQTNRDVPNDLDVSGDPDISM